MYSLFLEPKAIFWCILLPEILSRSLACSFFCKKWSSRNKATQEISTLCDSIVAVCCIFLDAVDSCHGIHLKFTAESTKMSETLSSWEDGLLHLFCWHYPLCGDHCIAGSTDCGGKDITYTSVVPLLRVDQDSHWAFSGWFCTIWSIAAPFGCGQEYYLYWK